MKLIHPTRWSQDFRRVGPGVVTIDRWRYLPRAREWAKLMVYHLLHLVDTAVFVGTLGMVTSNAASTWLFSDIWDDD